MSTKRRKSRNNNVNSAMSNFQRSSKQFKQIPSLTPNAGIGGTNNKFAKRSARLLTALIIMLIIIFVISAAHLF